MYQTVGVLLYYLCFENSKIMAYTLLDRVARGIEIVL